MKGMEALDLAPPKKRTEILYSRVTTQNKRFISKLAEEKQILESALVDHMIDKFREAQNSGRNKKKPAKRR
jgi:hypothetical protein